MGSKASKVTRRLSDLSLLKIIIAAGTSMLKTPPPGLTLGLMLPQVLWILAAGGDPVVAHDNAYYQTEDDG
jgi:hypothetical protein